MNNKIVMSLLAGVFFFSASAFASVPHDVDKYAFHIDLPEGFTKVVVTEDTYQRVYDSYHGNHVDKAFVHIRIQGLDIMEDWSEEEAKYQLERTTQYYITQGAEILKAEVFPVNNHIGILLNSRHNGKEHFSLQLYCNMFLYSIAASYGDRDKAGVKEFLPMMQSVQCKKWF